MLTKVQSDYLKGDLVLEGVWDTIVKESPIIQRLPLKSVNNDIIKYNVELTMPTVSWLQPKDQITENTGTYAQKTTNIYTVIGDADTDKSMISMNPLQNPESIDIEAKAKAMAHTFEKCFIQGQTSTLSSAKEFKGLMRMLAEFQTDNTTTLNGAGVLNSQVIAVEADSGPLTQAKLDALIDAVKPGKPDMLLVSRRTRRKINALARASGSGLVTVELKEFGLFVPAYDLIPIFVSDFIPENLPDGSSSILTISTWNPDTARTTSYDNSIIFAMKISEEDVTGLQAGGMTHERETFVEDYNAIRNRFSWNVSAMCKKMFSLAALTCFNPDS